MNPPFCTPHANEGSPEPGLKGLFFLFYTAKTSPHQSPPCKLLKTADTTDECTRGLHNLTVWHSDNSIVADGAAYFHRSPGLLCHKPDPDIHRDIRLGQYLVIFWRVSSLVCSSHTMLPSLSIVMAPIA